MGAVDRGKVTLPSFLVASSDFYSAIPLFPFLSFLLYGLNLLKQAHLLCEEAGKLESEAPCLHATPLHSVGGGIKRVYRCQVEGYKEGPSTSCATFCAHMCRVHLGVGLVCPLFNKSFFNPDTFRHHKKSHINL